MDNLKTIMPEDYLMHYGVEGQKWGKRRWQNPDGSLTPEGYEHYGYKGNRYDRYEQRVRSEIEGKAEATYAARKKINPGLTKNENKTRVASAQIQEERRKMGRNQAIIGGGMLGGYVGGIVGAALTGNPAFLGISLASMVGGVTVSAGKEYCDQKRNIRLNDIANDYNLREAGDAKEKGNYRKIR